MKKRLPAIIALGLGIYGLLLAALLLAEKAAPQSGIRSLGDALWFSFVTLSTVGYGDLYPVSPVGRAIGMVFMLLSVGLLSSLLGMAVSFVHGQALPRLRLEGLRRKSCLIFSQANDAALALAEDLLEREKEEMIVFCQTDGKAPLPSRRVRCLPQDAVKTAQAVQGREKKTVFLLSENMAENYAAAQALQELPVQVYCRGPETSALPGVRFFDLFSCAARAFWQAYPLETHCKTIVIIGGSELGRALMDQAILVNCRTPFFTVAYHLFGHWDDYRRDHPALRHVFAAEENADGRDALIFHPEEWNAQPALLEKADRIIFCWDQANQNAAEAARLMRWFPLSGRVFAAAPALPAPGIAFGGCKEVCTKPILMHGTLDERAQALHVLYCRQTGAQTPWEKLSPFLKASNRASADHLLTKLRLLLPESDVTEITPGICRQAAKAWQALPHKEPYRQNEHERWMRFYALFNWRWGPEKSSERRTHPALLPYDQLPDGEREKDDSAWLQLFSLGAQEEDTP